MSLIQSFTNRWKLFNRKYAIQTHQSSMYICNGIQYSPTSFDFYEFTTINTLINMSIRDVWAPLHSLITFCHCHCQSSVLLLFSGCQIWHWLMNFFRPSSEAALHLNEFTTPLFLLDFDNETLWMPLPFCLSQRNKNQNVFPHIFVAWDTLNVARLCRSCLSFSLSKEQKTFWTIEECHSLGHHLSHLWGL